MATPGNANGDWWYWFSWAERIGPVHAPAAELYRPLGHVAALGAKQVRDRLERRGLARAVRPQQRDDFSFRDR